MYYIPKEAGFIISTEKGSSSSHAPAKWLETTLSGVYCQMVTVRSLLSDCNCLMSPICWLLLGGYC